MIVPKLAADVASGCATDFFSDCVSDSVADWVSDFVSDWVSDWAGVSAFCCSGGNAFARVAAGASANGLVGNPGLLALDRRRPSPH